jgi:UDPglucose 6-dehydrogenase
MVDGGDRAVKVTVFGQGYVGLVTAAGGAEWGHEVAGVERQEERLTALLGGHVPFHEPALSELVESHLEDGRLRFTAHGVSDVAASSLTFVAVGTVDADQQWETRTISACLADVVPHVPDDGAVVIRSTCPPEFISQLAEYVDDIRCEAGRAPIAVMLNPEFTKEGTAVQDFLEPDRVVIGVASDPDGQGTALLREFYSQVEAPILVLSAMDAILAKLGANLFLATKISFANELAGLCDLYGSQIERVIEGMAHDPRIGGSFLRAGIGFGGSCLPQQVAMTVRDAGLRGHETPLFSAVDEINLRQKMNFVDRIEELVDGLDGRRVALLGLTFKPHTDDLRAAPSLDIASMLIDRGATVVAFDPMEAARRNAKAQIVRLTVVSSAIEAVSGADVIALATEWPEFATLPWPQIAGIVRRRIVVDGRNALDPDALAEAGFVYSSFGRGHRLPIERGAVAVPDREIVAVPDREIEDGRVAVPVRAELAVGDR